MTSTQGRSQRFTMKGEENQKKNWTELAARLILQEAAFPCRLCNTMRAEEEWQRRGRLRTSHNNDATGEEFQKHKTFQAEMF